MHPAIAVDANRIRHLIEIAPSKEQIDLAILEALSNKDVNDQLGPILESGAVYTQCTMSSDGTMEGMVLLTLETEWRPGIVNEQLPEHVSVLLSLSPPKVLRVEKHSPTSDPTSSPFCYPTGAVPISIKGMAPPSPAEVLRFLRESNESVTEWLAKNGIDIGTVETMAGTLKEYGSTGSKCTSILCAEKAGDDDDYKD